MHGGVLLLVKLQAASYNFTKSNTPPWVFFTFLKLYKWYQIAQNITFIKTPARNIYRFPMKPQHSVKNFILHKIMVLILVFLKTLEIRF